MVLIKTFVRIAQAPTQSNTFRHMILFYNHLLVCKHLLFNTLLKVLIPQLTCLKLFNYLSQKIDQRDEKGIKSLVEFLVVFRLIIDWLVLSLCFMVYL